jgi:calcineurin-like phosphoesterase family protein
MPAHDFHKFLRTIPIPPHIGPPPSPDRHAAPVGTRPHSRKPVGKPARPLGDPVAPPKQYPRYVPPPTTGLNNLSLALNVVLPGEAAEAETDGALVFHSVGDTGGYHGDEVEKSIADAMDKQLTDATAAKTRIPAFYYNLGDVVYFNGLSTEYDRQFYEPYQGYHASIFAVAGNHDGDTSTRAGDPVDNEPSLFGFMRNFCDVSAHHDSPYRATMTQPYVYWTLDAPFVTIVGLYSNVDGSLDARGKSEQQQWFETQVRNAPVAKDKALIIAVHHPPYSLDTTHGGYPDIGIAIDRVIQATGRIPTAVLSGHVHSYQRFERDLGDKKVPYVIAGAGGYANTFKLLHKIELHNGQPLPDDFQTNLPDVKLAKHNDKDPGFLRVTVDDKKKTLTLEYFLAPFTGAPGANAFDSVTVPW